MQATTIKKRKKAITVKGDRARVKRLDADAVGRDHGRQVGGGVAEHRARPMFVRHDARVVRLAADRRRVEDELFLFFWCVGVLSCCVFELFKEG